MASDDPAGTRPAPVALRIKLRYDSAEALAERFAPHVGRSGLFLPTRVLQPIGTEIKFELRLANDQPVLRGLGRVRSVKEPDPEHPTAAYGLGLELMRVTPESRELILKLLARRRQLGLPDVALPQPEEIDAARRDAEAAYETSAITAVPRAIGQEAGASAPLLASVGPISGPTAVPVAAIAPLPAEPPRRKRRAVSEVIESASGPVAAPAIPGLDEEVDVGRVLARARTLAGSDLDQELEQLRDPSTAPLAEISIDAVSAELAQQLGGAPVRRHRSQGWAPPPAVVTEAAPVEAVVAEAAVAKAAVAEAAVAEAAEPASTGVPEPPVLLAPESQPVFPAPPSVSPETPPEPEAEPEAGVIERDEEDLAHLRTDTPRRGFAPANVDQIPTEPVLSLAPELACAEIEADAEHTLIGGRPEEPAMPEEPARVPFAAGLEGSIVTVPAEEVEEAEEEIIEEIDEFEIIAEADADDADLLAAYGEGERAASGEDAPPEDAHPPAGDPDFAGRLDLGDENSDFYTAVTDTGFDNRAEHARGLLPFDPRELSGGNALAQLVGADASDDFDEPHDLRVVPRASYARGGSPPRDPADEFDSHHAGFAPSHAPDAELESALDALDVEHDDVGMTHASTELNRGGTAPTRVAGRPAIRPGVASPPPGRGSRARSDDAVRLDFDDDDDS